MSVSFYVSLLTLSCLRLAVTNCTHITYVLCSNLGQITDYHDFLSASRRIRAIAP